MASIHLPIRQLVEFLLRTGSIDSRFAGFDLSLIHISEPTRPY